MKKEQAPVSKPKSAYQILDEQIETGIGEYNRSNPGLFISALSAGMEVGFSIFLMGVLYTIFYAQVTAQILHLIVSIAYPIGFIFVIIGRSELFTEHTTLAVLPVLKGSVKITDLLKIWGIIYVGNLIGGYIIGFLLVYISNSMNILEPEAFTYLSNKMTGQSWDVILLSSLMAGWLMGLLSWLVTSSMETISRIIVVILITITIGLGGLHHSIVGSIEVFTGLISSDSVGLNDYYHFQVWTTIGNIIGGSVFVALIKYGTTSLSRGDS